MRGDPGCPGCGGIARGGGSEGGGGWMKKVMRKKAEQKIGRKAQSWRGSEVAMVARRPPHCVQTRYTQALMCLQPGWAAAAPTGRERGSGGKGDAGVGLRWPCSAQGERALPPKDPRGAQAQDSTGRVQALPDLWLEPARAATEQGGWPYVSVPRAVLFYCPSLVINSSLSCLMWARRCRCSTQSSDS